MSVMTAGLAGRASSTCQPADVKPPPCRAVLHLLKFFLSNSASVSLLMAACLVAGLPWFGKWCPVVDVNNFITIWVSGVLNGEKRGAI